MSITYSKQNHPKKRKMSQSAAVVKLRSYVNKCAFQANMQTVIDPMYDVNITYYQLLVDRGRTTDHPCILVTSQESFEHAFELLDIEYAKHGIRKDKLGKKDKAAA